MKCPSLYASASLHACKAGGRLRCNVLGQFQRKARCEHIYAVAMTKPLLRRLKVGVYLLVLKQVYVQVYIL